MCLLTSMDRPLPPGFRLAECQLCFQISVHKLNLKSVCKSTHTFISLAGPVFRLCEQSAVLMDSSKCQACLLWNLHSVELIRCGKHITAYFPTHVTYIGAMPLARSYPPGFAGAVSSAIASQCDQSCQQFLVNTDPLHYTSSHVSTLIPMFGTILGCRTKVLSWLMWSCSRTCSMQTSGMMSLSHVTDV